ncbi:MAG: hypothetical protein J6Q69_02310 [Clostridia bacterium]|nr:hypothetical protein [Clostridia bacterium]
MAKNNITINEIITKSFEALKSAGYEPIYSDAEHTEIECDVQGTTFRVYELSEDLFGFAAEFVLSRTLDESERAKIAEVLDNEEVVVFEYMVFSNEAIILSSGFPNSFYDVEIIADAIATLTAKGGIAEAIKTL